MVEVKRGKPSSGGDFIKFLGTAGARFVMIKQLRASGGLWISAKGTQVLVDPGPGCLVRCASSRPRLDPGRLDGIILTHRHLDHCGDLNVMVEAMTEGGFKKRGAVFCPEDALADDPVMLRYVRAFPERIDTLMPLRDYAIGDFHFRTSMQHLHPVMTCGLLFTLGTTTVSWITDTRFFTGLADFYKTDVLIISVVFLEPRSGVDHLCLADAAELIRRIRPRQAILTHFGMTMLKAKPHLLAAQLTQQIGIEVVAAHDGMMMQF